MNPEWKSCWERHHAKAKIDKYYKTHRKEITWGDDYIAPPQARNTWIEIKMVQDEAEPVIYHETWDFNKELPSRVTERIMHDLRAILDIYNDTPGLHTPYATRIDNDGRCHLVLAGWNGEAKVMDMILRNGTLEWVKGEPDE